MFEVKVEVEAPTKEAEFTGDLLRGVILRGSDMDTAFAALWLRLSRAGQLSLLSYCASKAVGFIYTRTGAIFSLEEV